MDHTCLVFVGQYTRAMDHTTGKGDGIAVYILDEHTGELLLVANISQSVAGANPAFFAIDSIDDENSMLFVCNENGSQSAITSLHVQHSWSKSQFQFQAAKVSTEMSFGEEPCFISVPDEHGYAYVACYGVHGRTAVGVYHKQKNKNALKALHSFVPQPNQGSKVVKDRQELSHFHCAVPCNSHVNDGSSGKRYEFYASNLGTDSIMHFMFEVDDRREEEEEQQEQKQIATSNVTATTNMGQLVLKSSIDLLPGSGPLHLCLHPRITGVLYATAELSNEVYVVRFEAAGNKLERVEQRVSTLPPSPSKKSDVSAVAVAVDVTVNSSTSHVMCDHSGQYLYCANRGHDSIVRYLIHQETGLLVNDSPADVAFHSCHGHIPRHFNISPSNSFLLVANQEAKTEVETSNITVFRILDDGQLQFLSSVENKSPACVQFLRCKNNNKNTNNSNNNIM